MSSRLMVLALVTALAGLLPCVPANADETGTVRVVNDTDFTLEIRMDGDRKTSLSPGTKQTLRGIPPGTHRFQAVSSDGAVKFEKQLRLQAGQTLSWILKWTRTEGALVIDNPGAAYVRVTIDGEPTLGVPAEGFRVYGNLDEGTHLVQASLERHGQDIELLRDEVMVGEAGPAELTVPTPTTGAIAVRSEIGGALQVVVDGQARGWLLRGEKETIQACAPGEHRVVLRDRAGYTLRDEMVSVAPLQTALVVVVPPEGEPMPTASSRGRPVWVRTDSGWDLYFER